LQVDGYGAILDLTGRALRLTGLAVHPEFAANERLFVSYTCDSASDTSPACGLRRLLIVPWFNYCSHVVGMRRHLR